MTKITVKFELGHTSYSDNKELARKIADKLFIKIIEEADSDWGIEVILHSIEDGEEIILSRAVN